MIFRFETPWALLTVLLPLLWFLWNHWRRRKKTALGFSSVSSARKLTRSLKQRLLFIPRGCLLLAWICLGIALARPQGGREQIRNASQGIAIEMVLDRSGSMQLEMEFHNRRLNRLETAKSIFSSFVYGDKALQLKGRPNDMIGMISFARYADTICPLTLEHGILKPFLESVKLVSVRNEDGTAIGDALALAAARLASAEKTMARQRNRKADDYEIKSKIIILLTDGEDNCSKRSLEEAADLAAKWGIKIYAIGIGGGEKINVLDTFFGNYKFGGGRSSFNSEPLEKLAGKTGGLFRLATDGKSLAAIYREIDEMEKSEVESMKFIDYREYFPWFAGAALLLLILHSILTATVFRKIP